MERCNATWGKSPWPKRVLVAMVFSVLLVVIGSTGTAIATDNSEISVSQGSYAMSTAEIAATLPASVFIQSAEGQAYAAVHPKYAAKAGVVANTASTHCYGQVYWRAGQNIVGITLWKVWNHTSWCGVPYDHIINGSVYGHDDEYTCCLWGTGNESWSKRTINPRQRVTDAHAKVFYGLNSNPIQSHSVDVAFNIFAAGGTSWATW